MCIYIYIYIYTHTIYIYIYIYLFIYFVVVVCLPLSLYTRVYSMCDMRVMCMVCCFCLATALNQHNARTAEHSYKHEHVAVCPSVRSGKYRRALRDMQRARLLRAILHYTLLD